jgi:hypothetical protein
VKAILADVHLQGHLQALLARLESKDWREFWAELNLTVCTFGDLGLVQETSDAALWHLCQRQQIILLTANRNTDGPDSLEVTLRTHNTPSSLPVFTIGDAERVLHSRDYADRVVERLLEYLLEIDRVRGTGRLYLP